MCVCVCVRVCVCIHTHHLSAHFSLYVSLLMTYYLFILYLF